MKSKIIFSIIFLSFFSSLAGAQSPSWLWAKSLGGAENQEGYSITVDDSGNVYTAGWFRGTVDFDPGISVFNLTSAGGNDIFICKLTGSGNFLWAKKIGGTGWDVAYSLALDDSGNIYTTGHFELTVDFNPGGGVYNLTSNGNTDIFIAKLNSSGNFLWARSIGGAAADMGHSIKVKGSSDIFLTGHFAGTVDFNPSNGVYNLTTTSSDAFVLRLNTSGDFVFARQIQGSSSVGGTSIDIDDSQNIYLTGTFKATADFDPDSVVNYFLTSNGEYDNFILKLDSIGNLIWAKSFGGIAFDESSSISIDNLGNVFTTGYFSLDVDFDPGSSSYILSDSGDKDIFISKLDNSGNFLWAKQMIGVDGHGYSIVVDTIGNVYSSGSFRNTTDFNPGIAVYNLTADGIESDIFLSKLDENGNFIWATSIGRNSNDESYAIAIDESENIYMTGAFFSDSISIGSTTLTSAGNWDVFVAKLDQLGTGIINIDSENGIKLFPNPTTNKLEIEILNGNSFNEIIVFDILGRIVFEKNENQNQKENINTTDFPAGIYFVQILLSDGNYIVKKLIKQ